MTPWLESIIARGDRRSTGADHGLTGRVQRSELVPITVVPDTATRPSTSTNAFDVHLKSGVRIAVVPGFDEVELRRLVQVLQAC